MGSHLTSSASSLRASNSRMVGPYRTPIFRRRAPSTSCLGFGAVGKDTSNITSNRSISSHNITTSNNRGVTVVATVGAPTAHGQAGAGSQDAACVDQMSSDWQGHEHDNQMFCTIVTLIE